MNSKKKNISKKTTAKTPQKPPPPKGLNLSTKLKEEILGILTMALCVLMMLAVVTHRPLEQPDTIMDLWRTDRLSNMLGLVGAFVSYYVVTYSFGYAFIAFPILFFVYGWLILTHKSILHANRFAFYILTLMVLVSVWTALPFAVGHQANWELSGLLGGMLSQKLYEWLGGFGSITLWVIFSLLWLILVTRVSIADLAPAAVNLVKSVFRKTADLFVRFRHRQRQLYDNAQAETEKDHIDDGNSDTPLVPVYLQTKEAQAQNQTVSESDEIKAVDEPTLTVQKKTEPSDIKTSPVQEISEKIDTTNEKQVDLPKKQVSNFDSGLDTGLINDLKVIGRVDKQFVVPPIEFLEKDNQSEEKSVTTDSADNASQANDDQKNDEQPIEQPLALNDTDFKNLARNVFDQEHASVDLDEKPDEIKVESTSVKKSSTEKAETKEENTSDQIKKILKEEKPLIDEMNTLFSGKEKRNMLDDPDIPKEVSLEPVKSKSKPAAEPIDYDKGNQAARNKYRYPSLDLLEVTKEMEKLSEEDIRELDGKINQIITTLSEFGIDTRVTSTEYGGPVLAIYQLALPSGLKISKITGLEDELAMAMKVKSVRIVPRTDKGTIQVEIPKPRATPVLIRSLFEDRSFKQAKQKYRLGLALGKTIDGAIHFEDLAKMPHLLIAGTTGSGKSVGVNSMITSLLYQFDPSEVKFVMIDPKKVELALYRNLRNHHLICLRNQNNEIIEDVITKPENAKLMLKALVEEMESRYEKLAHANVRNLEDYNRRWSEGKLPSDEKFDHYKLEYIVAIIDELADLMMTAAREVETYITRLAQMARAVGIHLIVATQRPSVDVLTGLIKANFPARIAYQVRSKIDSRTILDMGGAELLLGKGDMLYLPPGHMPIRIQNAFTSTQETEQIVDFIGKMPAFPRRDFVMREEPKEDVNGEMEAGAFDALYNEALEIVVKHNQGSASLLQRRLSIGYARAARIVDQLERMGIVTAQDGGKARQVLITEDQIPMYRV
ncbi:DNA translocase FtsK [bacterium]|nr:DNA translocase FtsK [bacterium]